MEGREKREKFESYHQRAGLLSVSIEENNLKDRFEN
jgi:hypothetical protein